MRRLVLPAEDAPRERRYTLADPVAGREVWARAYRARYYGEGEVTREDVASLLVLVSDWLAVVEAPTTRRACEMVRDLRRRLREVRGG